MHASRCYNSSGMSLTGKKRFFSQGYSLQSPECLEFHMLVRPSIGTCYMPEGSHSSKVRSIWLDESFRCFTIASMWVYLSLQPFKVWKVADQVLVSRHRLALIASTVPLSHSHQPLNMQVETYFRIMWANHGDDISFQYAGTGALKSGFTRTGVRTKAGLVDDGVKSGKRYFLNNFQDGHKQDAIDLVTGNYVVQKGDDSVTTLCVSSKLI